MRKLCFAMILASISFPAAIQPKERAIVFVGGLNSRYGMPAFIAQQIHTYHPEIPFVELKIGDGTPAATHVGMQKQLDQIYAGAQNTEALKDKVVTLIGASQGGVLALGLLSMHGHELPFTIDSFMTIASPLAGEYGLPGDWERLVDTTVNQMLKGFTDPFEKILKQAGIPLKNPQDPFGSLRADLISILKKEVKSDFGFLDLVFYNPIGQDLVSIAGYWHDPLNPKDYLQYATFLPVIANEVSHPQSARCAANVGALKKMLLISALRDDTVKPYCSAERRFFKDGSTSEVEKTFKETRTYRENLLNLGTMYDDGRLEIKALDAGHGCESGQCRDIGLAFFDKVLALPQ